MVFVDVEVGMSVVFLTSILINTPKFIFVLLLRIVDLLFSQNKVLSEHFELAGGFGSKELLNDIIPNLIAHEKL